MYSVRALYNISMYPMNYMILKIGGTGARLDPLNQIGRVGYGTPSSSPHISG